MALAFLSISNAMLKGKRAMNRDSDIVFQRSVGKTLRWKSIVTAVFLTVSMPATFGSVENLPTRELQPQLAEAASVTVPLTNADEPTQMARAVERKVKKTGATVQKVLRGRASWYGPRFHGKKTASGEIFDQDKLTAAHKTLPLGTVAKVTNLENGNSVKVEITDRGPYVGQRIIDLSYAAADRLGFVESGTAPVRIELLRGETG
jgi:rare lipoprotein A